MDRRKFLISVGVASASLSLKAQKKSTIPQSIGIIGLDTSHSVAFAKIINKNENAAFKVTHAYPFGSKTIESSFSRIPGYTEDIKTLGVEIVGSIGELLEKVDKVLLETNDGQLHLEQAKAVFQAGKTVFIDKPLAASLEDAVRIFELSEAYQVPFFSASSLRFAPSTQEIAIKGKIGKVLAADTYSPAKIEPSHPDLFWYGIHGVEALFTLMGTGCKAVRRIHKADTDVVIGEWDDGRIGTFRGLRNGKTSYGGTAYGTEGISTAGLYEGYEHLVVEIIEFFKTGIPPIQKKETLEIFAFMAAAEESKKKRGKVVSLEKTLNRYLK